MQTKSSYRVLKWTLLVGTAASLVTACVVTTSGDGGGGVGGDFSFGGDGTSTSGKTSTGGSQSTAGKTSTGGSGGSSTAGTAGTMTVGEGGAAYVPGVCEADAATPKSEPSCDLNSGDDTNACRKCMKTKCCTEWQACFASEPTIACGYGTTADADGQFDCIENCFLDGAAMADNADTLLADCAGKCANQCDTPDNGLVMGATSDLVDCANNADNCQADCFPFQ